LPPARQAAFELHRRSDSIASSTRADSVGGTSMPSALAVLRLMTSSNFVGAAVIEFRNEVDGLCRRWTMLGATVSAAELFDS